MNAKKDIAAVSTLTEIFAGHRNWTINTASLRAAGKGTYVSDLKAGRVGITVQRRDRIMQWFSDNWPDQELDWPRGIPRPTPKKEAA